MEPQYTTGEQAARIGNAIRGGWRIVRGRPTGRIDNADERRRERVIDRTERNARAAFRALDTARDDLATARNAEQRSRGSDKRAARQARIDAQAAVRSAENAARKYGIR